MRSDWCRDLLVAGNVLLRALATIAVCKRRSTTHPSYVLRWSRLRNLASHLLACVERRQPECWEQCSRIPHALLESVGETPPYPRLLATMSAMPQEAQAPIPRAFRD